ncbi:hypothetical protein V8E51_012529 [Hyaloscypha variabilis]
MASTNFENASHGYSFQSMASESLGTVQDLPQSLYRASAIPSLLPPSPASSRDITPLSDRQNQTMEIDTPAGRSSFVYQASRVTAFTGKHSRPATQETTPPPSSHESMLQELEDWQLVNSPRLKFGGDEPQQNHERSKKIHGMNEISRIIRNHLSKNSSHYDVEQHLEDGPKRKRQKRYHEPSAPTDQSPQSGSETRKHRAIFNVHWQVKEFVEEQFGNVKTVALDSVIAVTGNNGPILKMWYCNPTIAVHVDGIMETIIQIAQQLAWLGSALRTSESGSVGRSEAQISACTNHPPFVFNIEFATGALEEKSCWHGLFSNPVIAYNFPIPRRDDGLVGLEIPIKMMATLGGASHAVEFNGGLMLKGFSCMFVPYKRHGNSIQWHFITNEDNNRLEYFQADQQCPKRLRNVNQKSLVSTRAFLGWWGEVTTNLGTTDAKYENITWSSTKEPGRPRSTPVLSIRLLDILGVGVSFAMGPKDSKLHVSRAGHYERILEYASKVSVILYDTRDKRGWLVPSSAVIAHIAKTRHFRGSFSIAGTPVDIISTDPAQNIYEAAKKMLLENRSTKLIDGKGGSSDFYFEQMVREIWGSLEKLLEDGAKRESTSGLPMLKKQKLRGWEFMDLVDEISPLHLKETSIEKTCGGWINFAQRIDAIILFASGFEDIIEPAKGSTNGLCDRWKRVPKHKDYLVAGVPILNTIYERAGRLVMKENLTSHYRQRHRDHILFENCRSNENTSCNCDRLQQIESKERMGSGSVMFLGPAERRGAVIFGDSEPYFRRIQKRSTREGDEKENNPQEPHLDSPGLPGAASSLRGGRSPLKTITPALVSRRPFEADKEDTKDYSKVVHEAVQEVPYRISKGSQEGPEKMDPRTPEVQCQFPQ